VGGDDVTIYYGRMMRAVRRQAGLSQAEMARLMTDALGYRMDPSAVSRIESGNRVLTAAEADAVVDVYRAIPVRLPPAGDAR
jgi:transcriptional regulator with XRE-family HTH domain